MPEARGIAVLEDWEIAVVSTRLQEFTASVDGVRAAVVASVDGFALAHSATEQTSGERLAAMTSAMLALATAVALRSGVTMRLPMTQLRPTTSSTSTPPATVMMAVNFSAWPCTSSM